MTIPTDLEIVRNGTYAQGYAKGYNTGCKRADAALKDEREIAAHAVRRAERAEKKQGLGHCEDCQFWKRGGPTCHWGYCNAPTLAGTPLVCWIKAEAANGSQDARVICSERFGCVLFSPSAFSA